MEKPKDSPILNRAIELWHEREMKLPERVRRMRPDKIDYATGAWADCVLRATEELRRKIARR
jgi:hypothetical protein